MLLALVAALLAFAAAITGFVRSGELPVAPLAAGLFLVALALSWRSDRRSGG